eukprot:3840098-Amphidinium_carterae.1
MQIIQEAELEDWGLMDLQTTSDHRAVTVTMDWGVKVKTKAAQKSCRFVSDAHFEDFKAVMTRDPPAPWDGSSAPEEYMGQLMSRAHDAVISSMPRKAPRKPWISERTWNFMLLLNKYRRLQSCLYRNDATKARECARAIAFHEGEHYFPPDETEAVAGCIAAIKVLGAMTKRLLRADRKQWLNSLAEKVQQGASDRDLHAFHKMVKVMCRSSPGRKGLRLMNAEGTMVDDEEQVSRMWHQHWQSHFSATGSVAPVSFCDRTTRVFDEPFDESSVNPSGLTCDPDIEDEFFTEAQVLSVIKHMNARKASPDCVPGQAWRVFGPAAARPLAAMFNDFMHSRSVPLSYAGSRVVGVFKRKGSPYLVKNFRPVSLMMIEAKLFSKLLLGVLQKKLRQHCAQFGSGIATGTVFPQLIVRQLASAAKAAQLASATIFFDICAAFDRVLTPLLWGCSTQLSSDGDLLDFGYNQEQAQVIIRFLHEHPSILSACGIPMGVLAVLRAWGSHTWITTHKGQPTPENSCRTLLGVKQGDNMAAQVFDIFYGHILSVLFQKLRELGLLVDLTLPVGRELDTLEHGGQSPQSIQLGPLAFRDDLAIVLWGASNQELLTKVIHVTRVVEEVHASFHLQINYAASKSEATMALCKPDAKAVWQGMRMVGRARQLRCPALAISENVFLRVSKTYVHLGCQHSQDLSLQAEVNQMLSRSHAALKDKKPALRSKHLELKSRVCVHTVYVRCHLLQNVAVLQPFGQRQFERLQSEYMRGLRLCAGMETTKTTDHNYSNSQVLAKCSVPSLAVLMHKRALSFFLKLAATDHPMVRAALVASFDKCSFWTRIFEAINALRCFHSSMLSFLPIASRTSIGQWAEFAIHNSAAWHSLVKMYSKPLGPPLSQLDAHQDQSRQEQPSQDSGLFPPDDDTAPPGHEPVLISSDEEGPVQRSAAVLDAADIGAFACDLCTYQGQSFRGLQAHRRRSHDIHTPLSMRVTSAKCDCCDLNFGLRHRVLDHLRTSNDALSTSWRT